MWFIYISFTFLFTKDHFFKLLSSSAETLRSFAQGFPYATWIWARDTANLGQVYQVAGIPKTVIIDQDGHIRFTHTVVTYASTFIEEIDQLLD